MTNSYRIKTQVGSDQTINVQIDQEFDFLEILSLKIQSDDIYTRNCADYGVIVGRVTANGGFGLPNVRVSVFVPLEQEDENNEIISTLYPYKSTNDKNEDGYRYNLLPYEKSYSKHAATGTFPSRNDALTNPTVVTVYDKYYKFTVKTNDSGDYMIMGVPLGDQTVFMDCDLSDIGEFSLTPQDLIRMGIATESQLSGNNFKSSPDLQSLPQIVSLQANISVSPLWGQPEVCQLAINRVDFDLRDDANIDIQPTAVFMGSIISASDRRVIRKNCRPSTEAGNICDLVSGPGEILAIRQTIGQDSNGRPVLEEYEFDGGAKVIDGDGTWLVDLPMNLDYIITNEFGERTISLDPTIGVPTKGKYRFKVKWEQSPDMGEQVKRAYYLLPNVREYGWSSASLDPSILTSASTSYQQYQKSYAFSLDWNEYADPTTAISCQDTFYEFGYNRVYTPSQFIDGYHNGSNRGRFIGIKEILDSTCDSTNNKFPTNDGVKNFDLIFILFNFFFSFITLLLIPLMVVVHILAFLWPILKILITFVYGTLATFVYVLCKIVDAIPFVNINCPRPPSFRDIFNSLGDPFKNIALPTITYPDCELCSCTNETPESSANAQAFVQESLKTTSLTLLADSPNPVSYGNIFDEQYCTDDTWFKYYNTTYFTLEQQDISCRKQTVENPASVYQTDVQRLIAGNNQNIVGQRTPASIWFAERPRASFDLTLTERLNLFNLKNQYFNTTGGFNQVRTYVASDVAANAGQYHYDNTVTILCDPVALENFVTGRVMTFQNPFNSLDPNVNGAETNFSGFSSSTGYAKNLKAITVNYANPDSPDQLLTQQYIVNQSADTIQNCWVSTVTAETGTQWYYTDCDGVYHSGNTSITGTVCVNDLFPYEGVAITSARCQEPKFLMYSKVKSDCEYFQVITAMTYSNFSSLNPPVFTGQRSLNERYIAGAMYLWEEHHVKTGFLGLGRGAKTWQPMYATRPYYAIPDNKEICVVILQRGVDPNSTRQTTTVDISRICGQPYGTVQVTSKYKLNIPIQPGLVLPRHDQYSTNESSPIFFDSYIFQPGTNYSGYTTNMPSYYSSLDSTKVGSFQVKPGNTYSILDSTKVTVNSGSNGSYLKANTSVNIFGMSQYPIVSSQPRFSNVAAYLNPNNVNWYTVFGRYYTEVSQGKEMVGYWNDEYVEGGAYFFASVGGSVEEGLASLRYDRFVYFSPVYSTATTMSMQAQTQKIVMRTDRLPTSTSRSGYENNSYLLHQNTNFSFYFVSDEGAVESYDDQGASFLINEATEDLSQYEEQFTSTFTCQGLVPLQCYSGDSESFGVKPSTDACYKKAVVKGGCYVFVSKVILSLPNDFKQLGEYKARTRVNFAACRGVFGHTFINNWVNGVLYHFPFRNLRFYKSPLDPVDPNGPYNEFCKDTIVLHEKTNNFYYRSSPYNSSSKTFVGKQRTPSPRRRNEKEILFPTTVMDMGPRDAFTQEISLNEEFYGYNMTNIPTTTFQDPAEILNLFIISRQVNSKWLGNLVGLGDGSINAFFTRSKSKIDGDYAQMISINSELGVQEFNFEAYTAQSGSSTNNPFYVGQDRSGNPVIGIFFSSDTVTRDLVTPRRLIRNDNATYNSAVYDYLPVKTQEVPFYSWQTRDSNAIFGTENNDWRTGSIQKNLYQKLNRTDITSNYFMGENPRADFMKGYIYNRSNVLFGPGTTGEAYQFEGDKNTADSPSYDPVNLNSYFTVGLPFHFYFGLSRGKSAMNRFVKKYVD